MAYPPSALPTNRTNSTPRNNTLKNDINAVNAAVNDVVTELGANPSGGSATVDDRITANETSISTNTTNIGTNTSAITALQNKNVSGLFSARPAAGTTGRFFYATDTDRLYYDNGSTWQIARMEGDTTIRHAWNYSLPGEIKVASGSTDYLPPALITVPSGQSVTLVGYMWTLWFGTSFTFTLRHRTGASLATTTDLVAGVVAAAASIKGVGTFTSKVCVDADSWQPLITAVSGTPTGGAITMLADVTV